MRLSVCMIVRNEEQYIRSCLESLPTDVEIIIVDTGSTDNTITIINSFEGVRLFHYEWNDDFAEARNYSISLATGSHIFVLDADERFQKDTYNQIISCVAKTSQLPAAVMIRNVTDSSQEYRVHRMVRLFPNNGIYRFHGSVHEVLHKAQDSAKFIMSEIMIDHFGYNQSNYREQKYERYYSLYHSHLGTNPSDGYMWYQLGKLHASVDELEEACDAFIQATKYMTVPTLAHGAMIVEFSKVLRKAQLYEDALHLLENNQNYYSDYPDLWFQLGLLYMDVGELELIPIAFEKALYIGDSKTYATVEGVGSFLAAYNLGVYYEITGNIEEALRYYNMATTYEPAVLRVDIIKRGVIE